MLLKTDVVAIIHITSELALCILGFLLRADTHTASYMLAACHARDRAQSLTPGMLRLQQNLR